MKVQECETLFEDITELAKTNPRDTARLRRCARIMPDYQALMVLSRFVAPFTEAKSEAALCIIGTFIENDCPARTEKSVSLAAALGVLEKDSSAPVRLKQLLSMRTEVDFANRLRGILKYVSRSEFGDRIDYRRLLLDVLNFELQPEGTRARWAKDAAMAVYASSKEK